MNFYGELDWIMKQDLGNRGLLPSLPPNPVRKVTATLLNAKKVIILTGFPVSLTNGQYIGETDGPSGTANLAAALIALGCSVSIITDAPSYNLLEAALSYRAPEAELELLPFEQTETFIENYIKEQKPTHFISLERPGKAADGHLHNMRGEIIDHMVADSSSFLDEAKKYGAVTISIGDGGNEMGMGYYKKQIISHVPSGDLICTAESADHVLAGGVSNWWGWGLAASLSYATGLSLLPCDFQEAKMLEYVVSAGGVDGCTKKQELTVDNLSLETHLSILGEVAALTSRYSCCRKLPKDMPHQILQLRTARG